MGRCLPLMRARRRRNWGSLVSPGVVSAWNAANGADEECLVDVSFEDCIKDTVDRFLAIEKDVN